MYRAPVADITHALRAIGDVDALAGTGAFPDLSSDLVEAIVAEAGRFATERIAPLATIGDRHGTPLAGDRVTMPPGWREAYTAWCEGGWNALTGPPAYGGQGLPVMLSAATQEMWNGGSLAFGIGPTLTIGAVEALAAHGSETLRAAYLPKLVSGEWMATMNLTEPQAGSDLGALRTRAERAGDGTYRIFGTKIFITYGEHDLTDNIIHLVLARLPDAPAGTRGISLFLVPKFLPDAEGHPAVRNDLRCAGVEHKIGIHASPTCTMLYGEKDGAVGYLIGEENRGLACMFTMMNNARLAVGIQGVAVAEAATQKAVAYAAERRQGRAPGATGPEMSPIIEHPDVKRMLLTMRAMTAAARAICYACAAATDRAHASTGDEARRWADRAALLTPLAKAFSTDVGVEVASLGVQVHGGMGYVEETGAAIFYRDARITPIYEGTNGIQAIDLVTRKLPLAAGGAITSLVAELSDIAESARASNRLDLRRAADRLSSALADLGRATAHLQTALASDQAAALAGATPYLRLASLCTGGGLLLKGVLAAAGEADAPGRALVARFFAENLLPETAGLADRVIEGAETVNAATPALLLSA